MRTDTDPVALGVFLFIFALVALVGIHRRAKVAAPNTRKDR